MLNNGQEGILRIGGGKVRSAEAIDGKLRLQLWYPLVRRFIDCIEGSFPISNIDAYSEQSSSLVAHFRSFELKRNYSKFALLCAPSRTTVPGITDMTTVF